MKRTLPYKANVRITGKNITIITMWVCVCVSSSFVNYWIQAITWFRHGQRNWRVSAGVPTLTQVLHFCSFWSFKNDFWFKNWGFIHHSWI